jgi:hypothetical protein
MTHRRTDPACRRHKPPRGRFRTWRFNRARGRSCMECAWARYLAASDLLRDLRRGVER